MAWRDIEIAHDGGDRLAAAVHVGGGLEQAQLLPRQDGAGEQAVELGLQTKGPAMICGDGLNEPETDVVARGLILGPGIAEADDQADAGLGHGDRRNDSLRSP